jgi:GT2 family glycosyltransferase
MRSKLSGSGPSNLLSVIFVTYNSEKTIGAALSSVRRHLSDAEIIVVDNGSTDQTSSLVGRAARTLLLQGHGNIGFGAGVNLGVRHATRDLVLVLNPDTIMLNADIGRLQELAAHPPIGLLGCLISDNGGSFHSRYGEWGWRRELYWAMLQWFLMPHEISVSRPRKGSGGSRVWISGAAFLVSRREFLDLGGFDESIFLYFEDQDLSRRYQEHGVGVHTTNAVTVTHERLRSSGLRQEQIQSWGLMSLVQLATKWQGRVEGERAARALLRLLRAISLLGGAGSYLPLVGARAERKSYSAELVRLDLLAGIDAPPRACAYRQARSAIAAATRRRHVAPSVDVQES